MDIYNKTILITGGGSGIGYELAARLSALNNTVIIAGRNADKLREAERKLPHVYGITCDITREADVNALADRIDTDFHGLDILINNAGKAHAYHLSEGSGSFEKAGDELITNFLSTIRLTEKLLPLLRSSSGAIVTVSSVLALVPALFLPTYSASKAALHSYMQTLRVSLQPSGVRVYEVLPPLVDTAFSKDLRGEKMSAAEVAAEVITGMKDDVFEIHVGKTKTIYQMYLASPQKALGVLNGLHQN